MKRLLRLLTALSIGIGGPAMAHHSFAIYDIDNRIERTGVLTAFAFTAPHITLELKVTAADGGMQTWHIETMAPRRWDRHGLPHDIARVGETVTLQGWPARRGKDGMLLSTIATARGTWVIIDKVRQKRARAG